MKIYEIPQQVRHLLDSATVDEETGEVIFDKEQYDQVTGDARAKIANTARFLREEDAEIAAMKQVIANIMSRLDAKKRRYEYLQDLCLSAIQALGEKVEEPDIRVSTRRSDVVRIEDGVELPEEYLTIKTTVSPNKLALKAYLKTGGVVPGVSLEDSYTLLIK